MMLLQALATLGLSVSVANAAAFSRDISNRELGLFPRAAQTTCGTTGTASCTNTTAQANLCCFEAPGGLLAQTQFWDTNPSTGPSTTWTIHGLWPDRTCDQTYDESCDSSRAYTDITGILNNAGQSSLVSYLTTYMISNSGTPESFWEHEWGKHGTCMSTLKPACIPSGSVKGQDAVYFFQTLVKLYKTLPTYEWLAGQGITPDSSKTYTLATLNSALKTASGGYTPLLSCTSGVLTQIAWYFHLKGSIIDGSFVPISSPATSSCPSSGIKYPPKSGGSGGGGSVTTTAGGSTPTGLPSKGTIVGITSSGAQTGGLLTAGTWSTQTLATITFTTSGSGFTIKTSKGLCAVSGGALSCSSSVTTGTVFTSTTSGGNLLLTYSGSTAFTADATPSGSTVATVYTGSSHSVDFSLAILSS